MFVPTQALAGFLAVGKRSAFRPLPGAALRSALGCKNVAAAGGASAVQSFKLRKTKGKACCFLHAGACATSVSGFCRSGRIFAALVCLGECEVFASELALAEACADPKSGPRGGPKFGAFLLAGDRRSQVLLLLGMFARDALEHIAILESFKPAALDRGSPDGR